MLEIVVIVALTLLNGVFAMSELAVMSSRKARLQGMAGQGVRGARGALRLIDNPGRFLSTVQIGITMVGVIAGAYGGATLGGRFGAWLKHLVRNPGMVPNETICGVRRFHRIVFQRCVRCPPILHESFKKLG
jgi:putative hemolysin